jgi:hypothetical protein
MPQAISTKYISATNTKPARIKATTGGGYSLTISYPHDDCNPHIRAAQMLARKMGWGGTMIEGHTTEGSVFVFSYGDKFEI